jgi:hypothetical protein
MAIKNNRIFGLSVSLSLADVPDRKLSLRNIGINTEDLEIIRGISEGGFDKNDLQTISNLSVPVWRSFDRYINDVSTYGDSLTISGGADFQLRGNLEVSGGIGSTAFRYTILDTEPDPENPGSTPILKWGDISTSRVSSWSTIGNSISYGADVEIGGTLKVGKIKTRTVPTTKEFNSEVATHKIKLNLNGTTKYIYAMKGIPLRFKGYFRSFLSTIRFVPTNNTKVSWRIARTDGLVGPEDFRDYGESSESKLEYQSPFAAERYIEIYYAPDSITSIELSNTNIQQLPKVILSELKTFIFANNGLVNFPDISFLAPRLTTINLNNNNFYNGDVLEERKLSQSIADKLPETLEDINLRGCFFGGIEHGIFTKFQNLRSLNIQRSGSPYFYPDNLNPNGELPVFYENSGAETDKHKLTSFNASYNDFRSTGIAGVNQVTIENIDTLVSLNLFENNNLEKNDFQIKSSEISEVNIGRTKLSCPEFQSRKFLTSFSASENTNVGSIYIGWDGTGSLPNEVVDGSYKFINCSNLKSLSFYNSSIAGYIPKFIGNGSLESIDLRSCEGLIAGRPEKAEIKCLYEDTFDQARNVSSFLLSVDNPNFAGPIDINTFVPLNESLSTLHLFGAGRFTGSFPNLDGCSTLTDIRSYDQGWGKDTELTLPNFSAASGIREIRLYGNKFTGSIKYVDRRSLDYLNVSNNQLTSVSSVFTAPNLRYFYASSNKFSANLPNLTNSCPKVEYVSLNNNQYTSYNRDGGLIGLSKLKQLDLSSNILSQTAVDNILFDLVDNYKAAKRGGVIVNLLGSNASPSPYPIILGILTSFDPLTQPTIENGVVTDLGSIGGIENPENYSPKSGTYANVPLSYSGNSANGTGATVTVNVSVDYDERLVKTIGSFTAGKNDDVFVTGIVNDISSFTAPRNINEEPPYTTGIYTDSNPPSGATPAEVSVSTVNGEVTGVVLVSGGSGYSNGDTITVQTDISVDVTGTYNENPGYTSGTFSDSNPPVGGTAAKVTVTQSGGYVTGVTLSSAGTGYSVGDIITVQTDVTVQVTEIIDRYYNSASYSVSSINKGGSNYAIDDELKTSNSLQFEDSDGIVVNGHLLLTAASLTSRIDTSIFKGIAAVEYLRNVGWTIQVNN